VELLVRLPLLVEGLTEQGGEVVEIARLGELHGVRVRDDLVVLDLAAGAREEQVFGLALTLLLDRALALGDQTLGGLANLRTCGLAEQLEAALEALDVADRLLAVLAERGREFLALRGLGEVERQTDLRPEITLTRNKTTATTSKM